MLEKEKGVFLAFVYGIGCISIFVMLKLLLKLVSLTYIGLGALFVMYLLIIPIFRRKYYARYDMEYLNGIRCWIPVYNEISMFNFVYSILTTVTFLLLSGAIALTFIKPGTIDNFTNGVLTFDWSNMCIVAAMLLFVLHCIVKGLGWCEIVHTINQEIDRGNNVSEQHHIVDGAFVVLQYMFLFIPVFRAISILMQYSRLQLLYDFQKLHIANSKTLEHGILSSRGSNNE